MIEVLAAVAGTAPLQHQLFPPLTPVEKLAAAGLTVAELRELLA
jgi:hypothetical protein